MQSSGHKVLITGGSKGIGHALAKKFHSAGNDVTIVGRSQDALNSAARKLPGIRTIRADITTPDGIDALVNGAADISVLVNNAGVQFTGAFSNLTREEVDREVSTNLLAPVHLVHRFLCVFSR